MLGISGTELVIILLFGFLIFGPDKLPQIGRTVGRAIRQFRDASEAANKKFKEEVADPFQEAVAPYKDQVEESAKPLKDDIAAINDTFNETKSMITDPFKDMFKPTTAADTTERATGVVTSGTAQDPASEIARPAQDAAAQTQPDDPFADILDDAPDKSEKPAGKPLPTTSAPVKKSLASSLYDLDDDVKDGE